MHSKWNPILSAGVSAFAAAAVLAGCQGDPKKLGRRIVPVQDSVNTEDHVLPGTLATGDIQAALMVVHSSAAPRLLVGGKIYSLTAALPSGCALTGAQFGYAESAGISGKISCLDESCSHSESTLLLGGASASLESVARKATVREVEVLEVDGDEIDTDAYAEIFDEFEQLGSWIDRIRSAESANLSHNKITPWREKAFEEQAVELLSAHGSIATLSDATLSGELRLIESSGLSVRGVRYRTGEEGLIRTVDFRLAQTVANQTQPQAAEQGQDPDQPLIRRREVLVRVHLDLVAEEIRPFCEGGLGGLDPSDVTTDETEVTADEPEVTVDEPEVTVDEPEVTVDPTDVVDSGEVPTFTHGQGQAQGQGQQEGKEGKEQGQGQQTGKEGKEQGQGQQTGKEGKEQGQGQQTGKEGKEQDQGQQTGKEGKEQDQGQQTGKEGKEQGKGQQEGKEGKEQDQGQQQGKEGKEQNQESKGKDQETESKGKK